MPYSRQLGQENFPIRKMLKWRSWGNTICLEQGKGMFMFIEYKKYEIWYEKSVIWTHILKKSSWFNRNTTPSVQQFKWRWMNPWWWLKSQVLRSSETKTSLLLYSSINHLQYIQLYQSLCNCHDPHLSLWLGILSFAFEFRQHCWLWGTKHVVLAVWRHL